jgi:hypothetical protein
MVVKGLSVLSVLIGIATGLGTLIGWIKTESFYHSGYRA